MTFKSEVKLKNEPFGKKNVLNLSVQAHLCNVQPNEVRFFLRSILFLTLLISGNQFAFSQTPEEMRTQADAYFEKGNYVEATPLYSKILALDPKNYDVNFRYGVCLLYNSHNKGDAIRYLKYAVTSASIDKRAFFYLGRAYHLNYQFNEAIVQYEKFKTVASPTQLKDFEVDVQIQACKNGKRLLTDVTDMIVIQKTEIGKDDFYEIYRLNNIGGNLLVYTEFQTKLDKSKNHRPIIHFPANSPAIYYSSYGEDGSTGLDIYVTRKLPDGNYSKAQKVPGGVNTPYDEDFAYMHPDGKYLYFCSKGHNSMGGYDVFRCAYNDATQSFGPAENMDFAISSPDDDILFVVDSLDQVAYFSSARESQDGKIFVYEVRVQRIPMQMAVIKGSFVNSIIPTNKLVTIRVEDFSTGAVIGTFNSKEANGDYLLTFPKAGKYKFFISVKGADDEHYAIIDIPYTSEFKPLKQRITLYREDDGTQQVKVENLFNEAFDDPIAVMAEIYKEMSTLMPNASEYNLDSLDKINKNNDVFVDAGLDPFATNDDVIKVIEDEIQDLKDAIAGDEENASVAYNLAETKSDSANAMMVQINKDIERAENTTDPEEKKDILTQVDKDLVIVERLNEESKDLVALGTEIDKSIAVKEEKIAEGNATLVDVKAAPDGDKVALGNVIEENKEFFTENIKNNPPIENVVDNTIKTTSEVGTNTQKLNNEIIVIRNDIKELEKDNAALNTQLDNTKKEKDREVIEQQIADNEKIIAEQKIALANKEAEYDKATNQVGTTNLGDAATIVDNPTNHTTENKTPLTDTEKNSIATKVTNNNLDNNIVAVNKVLDENGIGGPPVDLFSSNEQTQNYSLSDWTTEIDKEIERLQILQMNAVEPEKSKIGQEIERYQDLKEEKIQQYEVVTTDPKEIKPDIRADDVVDDYTQRLDDINKITDEGDKRVANLNLNEEVRDELLEEKKKLEGILEENPGAKNIEERIANIDVLVKDLDIVIEEDKKWIADNGLVVVDTDKIVADIDPSYQTSVNTIYKTTDPTERANQMRILNDNFSEKSNERIQELEAIVKANPNDEVAKAELAELKRLNAQLVTDNSQPLVKPVIIDVANLNPKVVPDQLLEDYTERKTEIEKITDPFTKKEAENNLNRDLSNSIRSEITALEELKKDNPGNTDIQTRIDGLKKLDDQINSTIVANEKWMDANPQTDVVTVDDSDVKVVNPDYQAEVDKINLIENPNDKEKAIEELNNDTEEKIDKRLTELEVILDENPNDEVALTEKKELTEIKTQIENNPDKALIEPTDVTSINSKASISEIMPDYDQKMNTIIASTETMIEKEKDKIDLNKNLVELIDEEIENLNNLKTTNPDATKDIDKRIVSLDAIKNVKLAEIKASEDKIGGSATTTRPAITVSSIMPNYDSQTNAITQNSIDEKTKLADQNKVNVELISAIDKKIAELEKEKLANPAEAANIDKDIQNLQTIKTQKQNEINLNNKRIDEINSGVVSNSPEISINTIMPDYDSKINAINQNSTDEKTKLADQNKVNTELVLAIDKKIAELEKEKLANPSQATNIDKEILSLQTIKTQKQNEITANNKRIEAINSGTVANRPEISINTLMPDYESRMSIIEGSKAEEKIKLELKNNVNTDLISAIDNKIAQLKNELITDPQNASTIQQEIDKLEELKEAKQAEIAKNEDLINSMTTGDTVVKSVVETNPEDYSSEEGKEIIESHAGDIEEIKILDEEITDLENQLAKADDPKEQGKIQKELDKKRTLQAKVENEIIEDLGDPNQKEYIEERSTTEVQGDFATANNPNNNAIEQANKDIERADVLMEEAKDLRERAADEKDPIVANQLLEEAFEKEQEAANLINNANKTYKTAVVIDEFASTDKVVITSVPEDVGDRESTAILTQAEILEEKANALNAEAAALIDSSMTVKKKLKPALVIEAQRLDSLAAVYRDEAVDLKVEGNDLKIQEDKILAALPETNDKQVDQETVADVIATDEYKNYYTEKTTADSDMFKAEEIGLDIKALEEKKEKRIREAVVTYGDGSELEKALTNDPELSQIQKSIDSLTLIQQKYRDSAIKNYNEADAILDNTDPQTRENIEAISYRDLVPTEKVEIVTLNPQDADYKAPTELDGSIFRTTGGNPVYTSVKPIPVDQVQPSGLVYKVQVGAFRKPLPPEYFNQFAPISGQKIADGITRYMVGYFTNFTVASNAKGQINGLGYSDAFVVAYCNGERISIAEAKEIEAGRRTCVGTNMEAVTNMQINQTTTATTAVTSITTTQTSTVTPTVVPTTIEEKQLTEYYTNIPDAAKANQVEIMKGLFWTVQIGVYSKPVKGSLLYNIQPLNSQLTEDGKIRYTTGVYCTSDEAVKRKNEVVQIGIEDAFVTAYYNGVRISLTDANKILAEKGSAVLYNCGGTNITTGGNTTGGNTTGGNTTGGNTTGGNTTGGNTTGGNTTGGNTTGGNITGGNTTSGNTTGTYDSTGLYRVRVGYFEGEVPQPFVELLLNNQDEGIVSESDFDENITFYTIPYTSEEEATKRREDLVSKGFVSASVEEMPPNVDAYGNPILVETAVETTGEVFFKEGIYYRILVGSYSSEVPGEYATIILQTENLLETEVDADGNTYIISTKIGDFNTVKERLVEFSELGFENMQIVTYYKYDPIPFEEGNKILNGEPLPQLTRYPLPIGISADPYIYYKDAVYFRVDIGRFYEEVPSEFANSIFEHSEENIIKEETFDGEIIFYTENIKSYEEAEATKKRLVEKGFTEAKLVAFHKYDEISIEKARQILGQ